MTPVANEKRRPMDDETNNTPDQPAPQSKALKEKHAHRPLTGMGIFVTDQELYELLGVPGDKARRSIQMLDADPRQGFPAKQKLWGNRYWPAVKAWFDHVYIPRSLTDRRR
jgi:hypothetical protein